MAWVFSESNSMNYWTTKTSEDHEGWLWCR